MSVRTELAEELGVLFPVDEMDERLEVLGVAVDLLRLRPEICLRLNLEGTETASVGHIPSAGEFAAITEVTVESSGLASWWDRMTPDSLTPAGAGALALLEDRL